MAKWRNAKIGQRKGKSEEWPNGKCQNWSKQGEKGQKQEGPNGGAPKLVKLAVYFGCYSCMKRFLNDHPEWIQSNSHSVHMFSAGSAVKQQRRSIKRRTSNGAGQQRQASTRGKA
ncbi:hypothetical protein niasHT_028431 [Heterodera trifolii]|uniref:Uncharacterized protein n=1 Tax=Heterodera trifolii TaxID=157864 RepID=A0ABD2JKP0_9BILA